MYWRIDNKLVDNGMYSQTLHSQQPRNNNVISHINPPRLCSPISPPPPLFTNPSTSSVHLSPHHLCSPIPPPSLFTHLPTTSSIHLISHLLFHPSKNSVDDLSFSTYQNKKIGKNHFPPLSFLHYLTVFYTPINPLPLQTILSANLYTFYGTASTYHKALTKKQKFLKAFPEDISHGLNTIESVWIWARTYSELRGIYALYESFRRFQKLQTAPGRVPSPKQAWVDLTETIISPTSVPQAENRIKEFITQENLFGEALKEVEGDMQCTTNQSPQQVLYNLYNSIALTELKGYMMMQFSYMLLKLYDKGNFTKEAQIMRDRYQERTNVAIESVKKVMRPASRELWKCDPKKHEKNVTYVEVTELLQGYIQNEVDLNPDGSCRESCSEYTYTKSHNCFKNLYCRQQRRCNGKIINCRYYDSDMWVCPADTFSGRRYEYVEYENGRVLGRKQGCRKGTVKVDSWWRWLFWHCSYCFCLCDEQGVYSDRYFNMRSVIADIKDNKVVTGLRFVKKNRIIHLQIQEGKLLPRGNIDVTTVRWVPVEDYKITDRNIFNGQDYHTLSWEDRSMDLDDLLTDDGHVLTGIRFKRIGAHLNFEIFITPFDFSTGQLTEPLDRSIWKDNINTDVSLKNPRQKLQLNNPDVSTRSPSPSIPDSKSDQYVEFTHTDIDRDAAQTTVPFLDAQPVESLLPVPLGGAGIYHKGRKNFGGFIAPKIITYDFSQHLQSAFPEDDVQVE